MQQQNTLMNDFIRHPEKNIKKIFSKQNKTSLFKQKIYCRYEILSLFLHKRQKNSFSVQFFLTDWVLKEIIF